jgi:hypothetical protein
MELCHSWSPRPVLMSCTKRYSPEEIRALCKRVTGPFWLRVEGKLIPVHGEACLQLACAVSAAYHDWLAYNVPPEDGFAEDMAEREEKARLRMEEPSSEESGWDEDE